jgi:hypothetical protein
MSVLTAIARARNTIMEVMGKITTPSGTSNNTIEVYFNKYGSGTSYTSSAIAFSAGASVKVTANSSNGSVEVKAGSGDDTVKFRDNSQFLFGTWYGGADSDICDLSEWNYSDFGVTVGGTDNQVNFTKDGLTLTTYQFENFVFADGQYQYSDLPI